MLLDPRKCRLLRLGFINILIFTKTIAHRNRDSPIMQSRKWKKKKSMKAFYATFILWYCLVRLHFLSRSFP